MGRFTYLIGILAAGVLTGADLGDGNHALQMSAIGRTPLSFHKIDSKFGSWTASGKGYAVVLKGAAADVRLNSGKAAANVRMHLIGANSGAVSEAQQPLPGKVNYFIGSDPKRWRTGISTFGRVEYHEIYNATDLAWYGNQGQLEYDLILRPGADAGRIAIAFDGASKLKLTESGDLRVVTGDRYLTLHAPSIYQDIDGTHKKVAGRYELRASNEVRFQIGNYDKSRTLVIDPYLVYSSYYGSDIQPNGIAVDSNGNVYVGGLTQGGYVPVPGGADTIKTSVGLGSESGVITKFNSSGVVQYSTFIGGSGQDTIQGIAVNASTGEAFATGTATSSDFPVKNATQAAYQGNGDAFALKLSSDGSTLEYSTYLGGSQNDTGSGIAVDSNGNAYVTGVTYSGNFPGASAGSGPVPSEAFIAELSAAGQFLTSAFVGANTQGTAITVDSTGAVYVAGATTGTSFTNINSPGPQGLNGGGQDAFVMKLVPASNTLSPIWATFLGGNGTENASSIAVDASGNIYVAGLTTSGNFPVTGGAVQSSLRGSGNAFVASLLPDASAWRFATYLGGSNYDYANSLALTSSGELVVAGNTSSGDFLNNPKINAAYAIQPVLPADGSLFYGSADSGNTWTPASNLGTAYSLSNVSPDPSNLGTIVATESGKGSGNRINGIVLSTDNGHTWQSVYSSSAYIYSLARSPIDSTTLYAVDSNGAILKSTNSGANWSQVGSVSSSNNQVAVTQAGTVVVVGNDVANRIFRSVDGGHTYTAVTPGLPFATLVQPLSAVVATDSGDDAIFVVTLQGIFKGTNDGQSWTFLSAVPNNVRNVALAQGASSTLYAADCTSVYTSADGGQTWAVVPGAAGDGICYVAGAASTRAVFGATLNSDVFISADGGNTWVLTGAGVDNSNIVGLILNQGDATKIYLTSRSSSQSGFIAKMQNNGGGVDWATYFGDSSQGFTLQAVAGITGSEDIWVTGSGSLNLPLTTDVQPTAGLDTNSSFIARISNATPQCAYSITPSPEYVYSTESVYLSVTAPSGCAWSASADQPWIQLKTGATGTGSGTVVARVQGNATDPGQVGHILVQDASSNTVGTFTISEPPASCTYTVSNTSSAPWATAGGDSITFTMTASSSAGASCPFGQNNLAPLAGYSALQNNGDGTFTVTVPPNQSINSQQFFVQAGSQIITVNQQSVCQYRGFPNGQTVQLSALAGGGSIGPVSVLPLVCSINPTSDAQWLTVTPGTGGTFNYSYTGNYSAAPRTGHIVLNGQIYTLTQAPVSALQFVPIAPCRVVETRATYAAQLGLTGLFGPPSLAAGSVRSFPIPQTTNSNCPQIPSAAAYSLNITVVPQGELGYLTVWPKGQPQPLVSTLNSIDGRVKANAAIVAASTDGTGSISVYAKDQTDLVIDINGYFVPASTNSSLAFYPITPCRIADTRSSGYGPYNFGTQFGPPSITGSQNGGQGRDFPIAASPCLPAGAQAQAYSLNVTAVPHGRNLGYLTVWPTGQPQPVVSTLNILPVASNSPVPLSTANAAIVPAGTNGDINVIGKDDTDVVIDIDGYFAPPQSQPGGLSYYPATPCRALDSRIPDGALPLSGTVSVSIINSACSPPSAAQAYVLNATVVPVNTLGYLSLWGDTASQPLVSTLNAIDGAVTSNMAIVPTTYGNISAFPTDPTALILDYLGFFAP